MNHRQRIVFSIGAWLFLLMATGSIPLWAVTLSMDCVQNDSFEVPALGATGHIDVASVPAWTGAPGAGWAMIGATNENIKFTSGVALDGLNTGFVNTGGEYLAQVTGAQMIPGATYRLQSKIGRRSDHPGSLPDTAWKISLYRADTAAELDSTAGTITTPGELTLQQTAGYTATAADAGKALEIRLFNNGGGSPQVNFDDVQLQVDLPPLASVLVANKNFEAGSAGWGIVSYPYAWVADQGGNYSPGELDGNTVAYSNGPTYTISQTTAATFVEGRTYMLTVGIGRRLDHDTTYDQPDTQAKISLLYGNGTEVAAQTYTIPKWLGGNMYDAALLYTAGAADAGQPIQIQLAEAVGGAQANFDNVRLQFLAELPAPGPIALQNPSFETPAIGPEGAGSWPAAFSEEIPGWMETNPGGWTQGIYNPNDANWAGATAGGEPSIIPDGENIAFLNTGYLAQNTAAVVGEGLTYTLSVGIGRRGDHDALSQPDTLYQFGLFDALTGLPLAAKSGGISFGNAGAFITDQLVYTPAPGDEGKTIQVRLIHDGGAQVAFDNVQLTAVPEPSTCMLLIAGLLGWAMLRRRCLR